MGIVMVKLIDMETGKPLRENRHEDDYFEMASVPQEGSRIMYYPFVRDEEEHFNVTADTTLYKVVRVVNHLQEYWNDMYKERYDVLLQREEIEG
ncbi:hypothetical protein [Bacillus phage Nachito]|nr:hypothetical protein [Bacillus phage Nachito]